MTCAPPRWSATAQPRNTAARPFVEVRKNEHPEAVGEPLLRRTTPPDYRERGLTLTMRRRLVRPRDRVLLVDDWIETGAQATAARSLIEDAEAEWIGVGVIVDALSANIRRDLNVRSLLRVEQL
jgi:adenine phosphoribosyltransferase